MKCKHIKDDGIQCQTEALKDGELCFFHAPEIPEKVYLNKMDKMVGQGKLDYGVSLRTAWILEDTSNEN